MELTKEQLDTISERLCALATCCRFVYGDAMFGSREIGIYCKSSYEVERRLRAVLSSAEVLLDNLHTVSAALDSLLIRDKVLDDVEVSDV